MVLLIFNDAVTAEKYLGSTCNYIYLIILVFLYTLGVTLLTFEKAFYLYADADYY